MAYKSRDILELVQISLCVIVVICKTAIAENQSNLLLPGSQEQMKNLAEEVCESFFHFQEDKQSKIKSCINNFSSPYRDVSGNPPIIQSWCHMRNYIEVKIRSSTIRQLIIAVPEDPIEDIMFNDEENESVKLSTFLECKYTIWSTVLNIDGTPSIWRKGPDLPPWKDEPYEMVIEHPQLVYRNDSTQFEVDATFKWHLSREIHSCSGISGMKSVNSCNKKMGQLSVKTIKKNQYSLLEEGLPLDDNCVFTIYTQDDRTFKVPYKTLSCDGNEKCRRNMPKLVENISIEASPGGDHDWLVQVRWDLKYDPKEYNITLRADRMQTAIVPGNQRGVTFYNVTGDGLYNVSIVSITSMGKASTARRAMFPARLKTEEVQFTVVMASAWMGVIFMAFTMTGFVLWRQRQARKIRHEYFQAPDHKLPKDFSESGTEAGTEDPWEVRYDHLLLQEVVGEGAFGVVRRGTLQGRNVAVKMLKDFPTLEEVRSFRAEMELMQSVGAHPHIVSLVGCCRGRRPLILSEYCSRGDLLSFLRRSWDVMVSKRNVKYYNNNIENSDYRNDLFKNKLQREDSKLVINKLYELEGICDAELTSSDLLSFCRQIAMGMEFLALNRVVHRDLAARNILVTAEKTLKIADFGLSRDVYQENQYKQKGNEKMPVKWMALESLTHRIYTTQSDVWSFGVVVWEVVTVGGSPYPEIPASRLPRLLRSGYRMPRPNNCSKQLYEVMLSCWRSRPRDRPTFANLHRQLDELLNSACADEYLSLELEADDAPPTPKAQRYFKMILRGSRPWARGECYERPLSAPNGNHYTSPPAHFKPLPV